MNIQTKLVVEQALFNFLMYMIVMVGGLTALMVNMIARLWSPPAHSYVAFISAGTMFGAALCHFFLHQNASYLAMNGDDGIKKYEADRKEHRYNISFVAATNMGILLIITGVTFDSVYQQFPGWSVGLAAFLLSVIFFVIAPTIAKKGWRS